MYLFTFVVYQTMRMLRVVAIAVGSCASRQKLFKSSNASEAKELLGGQILIKF